MLDEPARPLSQEWLRLAMNLEMDRSGTRAAVAGSGQQMGLGSDQPLHRSCSLIHASEHFSFLA